MTIVYWFTRLEVATITSVFEFTGGKGQWKRLYIEIMLLDKSKVGFVSPCITVGSPSMKLCVMHGSVNPSLWQAHRTMYQSKY